MPSSFPEPAGLVPAPHAYDLGPVTCFRASSIPKPLLGDPSTLISGSLEGTLVGLVWCPGDRGELGRWEHRADSCWRTV